MPKEFQRTQRVASLVLRELALMIHRDYEELQIKPISITHVNITRDFAYAKIYYTMLGDEQEIKLNGEKLKKLAPYFRNRLAKTINLRKTPELTFVYDVSQERGLQLSKLIDDAVAKDEKIINEDAQSSMSSSMNFSIKPSEEK